MPLALAFVDPQCGPCTALLPVVAECLPTASRSSWGDLEANEAKLGPLGHVLLQEKKKKDREISETYQAYGTPAMVLVGWGSIGSPVISSSNARDLRAHGQGRRSLDAANGNYCSHSRGEDSFQWALAHWRGRARVGPSLGPGRQADQPVSVAESLDADAAVLRPSSHFCQGMLDDLKKKRPAAPVGSSMLLLVSTGSVEANRALGLRSTILLDAGFETGRSLGGRPRPSWSTSTGGWHQK